MSSISKICDKCGKFGEFYVRKNGSPQDCCKKCFNKRGSSYQKVNKDKVNKRARNRYSKSPEKYLNQNKEWVRNHPNARKETNKKYRDKNLDRCRKWVLDWQKNNPDKMREKSSKWDKSHRLQRSQSTINYRAKKRQIGGIISVKEWNDLCNYYNNVCLCCGRDDVKLTLDHIVPVSKGGANVISNAQPLCKSCNSKKGTRIIDYRR